MGWEKPLFSLGEFCADIDMSASTFRFTPVWIGPAANITGTDGLALVAKGSLTYGPLGILQAPTKLGQPGHVMTDGVSKFLAGGTIAAWDPLTFNSGGTALIKATASGAMIMGRALMAVTSGAYGSILLTKTFGGLIP